MLGTSSTPYDLRFRFLDIPVRIHPLFWLMTAVLGWRDNDLASVLIWVGCVFVSILVHEFGHGIMAKQFRGSPSIVLYGLGGLCYSQGERTAGQRLAVLLAGPGAGFLLCAVVLVLTSLTLGISGGEHVAVVQAIIGLGGSHDAIVSALSKFSSLPALRIYEDLVFINVVWGLVNLLPIYPLDGGQATQVLLSQIDRRSGVRWGHTVSLITAGLLAVFTASTLRGNYYPTIMFGLLAVMNYQILQSLHHAQSFGVYHEDDWWRS